MTSEHFNTAGRDVKTGLTAAVIVSQWTWAATLLQSSNVAWNFGISGPFWYASGASIQVLLFGVLAIEVKRKAPTCHTFLEMVKARWGKTTHFVFIYYAFATNLIVTAMLILGGGSCMAATSGMNVYLASFLIPITVLTYTMLGGLKATFLASYIHTAIIFVGLVLFVTWTYVINDCPETPFGSIPTEQCNSIGSASVMYERLAFIAAINPKPTVGGVAGLGTAGVEGAHHGPAAPDGDGSFNRGGSYLTMLSVSGLEFGIINIVGNFGTVFVDQSYWQSAIAASPASAHKGYMLGGLVWFTIPFALATSLGLAASALNAKLTVDDASAGLVPPAAAKILMGDGGAWLITIMLFMAITSTGSAEAIAVSSLVTYDIYRKYINPDADGKQILKVSRWVVLVFGMIMGGFPAILNEFDIGLGWVYNFMGIMIGSAVVPIAALVTWKDASAVAAIAAAWIGCFSGVIAWTVTAKACFNETTKDTLGEEPAQLAGNCCAIGVSGVILWVISVIKPQNFDWDIMRNGITRVDDAEDAGDSKIAEWERSPEFLAEAKDWIVRRGVVGALGLIVAWPLATVSWGVFSKSIFELWTSIAMMWGWTATIVIILLPIWENRHTVYNVITINTYEKQQEAGTAPKAAAAEVNAA